MKWWKLSLIALALTAVAIPAAELKAAAIAAEPMTAPFPLDYCSDYDRSIGEGGQPGAGCWRQDQHSCGFWSSIPCYLWGDCSYCVDLGECIRCEYGQPEPAATAVPAATPAPAEKPTATPVPKP